jgi:hypothetical protein
MHLVHCPLFLMTRKHNVLEIGSVSCLRMRGRDKTTFSGPLERSNLNHWTPHVRVNEFSYVTTDSQSVSLSWCQAPIWDLRPIFLLLSLIISRQLWVCWCGVPSLTRGRDCSIQLLLGIANTVFFGSEHILLSLLLRLPQHGGSISCIHFLQEQGSPVIPPVIGFNPCQIQLQVILRWVDDQISNFFEWQLLSSSWRVPSLMRGCENHGIPWWSWPVVGPSGCKLTSAQSTAYC